MCLGPRPQLKLVTPTKGLAERDLVGVLEVGTDRQTASQTRHGDRGCALAQKVSDVERRGLSGGRRVGCDHDLADAVRGDAADELVDVKVLRGGCAGVAE